MDEWTHDATTMSYLFVTDLRYRHKHVHVLNKGKGPTRQEVLDYIASLNPMNHSRAVSVGPKDIFVLYYSGHGTKDDEGDFLFHTAGDQKLSQRDMTEAVAQLPAQHAVFIIDACHAGAFNPVVADMSTAVLAAARHNERIHKSYAKLLRERSNAMVKERGSVYPFFLAQNIENFTFNSDQWKQVSIGPLGQVCSTMFPVRRTPAVSINKV